MKVTFISLVDLDEVHHRDVPLCGVAGDIPLEHPNHVVRHIGIVVRSAIGSMETDFCCGDKRCIISKMKLTEHIKISIMKSLKTVPVDVSHLER